MVDLTIEGVVPSKSNSYQIVTIPGKGGAPGHSSLKKAKALVDYERSFCRQIARGDKIMATGPLTARLKIYYETERADLDNAFKAVFDCLQPPRDEKGARGVIVNDRQIRKIIAERFKDPRRPRAEISLTEYVFPGEQLLFPPTVSEVEAWVESNAPEHIKRALLEALNNREF